MLAGARSSCRGPQGPPALQAVLLPRRYRDPGFTNAAFIKECKSSVDRDTRKKGAVGWTGSR